MVHVQYPKSEIIQHPIVLEYGFNVLQSWGANFFLLELKLLMLTVSYAVRHQQVMGQLVVTLNFDGNLQVIEGDVLWGKSHGI